MMQLFAILIAIAAISPEATAVHVIEVKTNKSGVNYKMIFNPSETFKGECFDQNNSNNFSAYDYSIVIGMLVISLGIGVFYGFFDKNQGAGDFMRGSDMSVIPVTLSLTTSFLTAIELLGNPVEIFYNGSQFALIVISMILVIPFATKVFFPIYDTMKLTSCYEYLGMRFGKEMRIFGACLYILQMSFYTSVSVLAPAIALSKATGVNTRLAIVLIYAVCIFYSSQGGLKAVVLADTFQAVVLFVSLILLVVIGTYIQDGGITGIFQTAKDNQRLDIFDFDPTPTTRHTVFSVVIGGFFYWSSLLCVNQSTIQKAMSLKSLSKARIALAMSVVGLVIIFLINFYTGLMAFAKYETCDPFKSGRIESPDQLIPFYVMDTFENYTTFAGIFVAGIFAASLGTVAACLSSLSAVTIEDLLVSGINIKLTPEQSTRYAKWINFGYGVASFALIFLVEGRSILQATLTLNGLIGGILLGLFSLGVFFKRANLKGALYGGLLATLCVITLGIFALTFVEEEPHLATSVEGCACKVNLTMTAIPAKVVLEYQPWYASLYKVSYMWYTLIGTTLTIVFGLTISILTNSFSEWKISRFMPDMRNEANEIGKYSPSNRRVCSMVHSISQEVESKRNKTDIKNFDFVRNADDGMNSNDDTITIDDQVGRTGVSIIGVFGIDNPAMVDDRCSN